MTVPRPATRKVVKRENRGDLTAVTECVTCGWRTSTHDASIAMRSARAHIRDNATHEVVAEQAVEIYLAAATPQSRAGRPSSGDPVQPHATEGDRTG